MDLAIACGGHLRRGADDDRGGSSPWVTDEGLRASGFSHGTAGIAYALLRLYGHSRDPRFLEAAEEAIGYEEYRSTRRRIITGSTSE